MFHHTAKRMTALLLACATCAGMSLQQAAPLTASAGELLGESTFDYKIAPWQPTENAPARQYVDIQDGAAHISILVPEGIDSSVWDLQFRHRGLDFVKGHKYKVSFSARARREGMEITSYIGDLNDNERYFVLDGSSGCMDMGPAMDGRWGTPAALTTEYQVFSGTFIPAFTVENAEWTFRYAMDRNGYGGNAAAGDELWFDNMSIEDITDPDTPPPVLDYGYAARGFSGLENNFISVNQLGYYPQLAKHATLGDNAGDMLPGAQRIELSGSYTYEVVNAADGTVAYTGKTGTAQKDADSGDTVCRIDFSAFDQPGEYYIRIRDKAWRSFPFTIGDNIYSKSEYGLLTDALNYFYQNRSGVEILDKFITSGDISGLAHESFPDEATGYVQKAWSSSGETDLDTAKENSSSEINIGGGWYNGADFDKSMTESGIALWTLQNLYERTIQSAEGKEKFAPSSCTVVVPEAANAYPDLLDECRYQLDFMAKMQVQPDETTWGDCAGLYYHRLHGIGFDAQQKDYGEEHRAAYMVEPPTFAATLSFAACAAQAARLWAPYDADYAAELLERAQAAYQAYKTLYYAPTVHEEIEPKSLYAPPNQGVNGEPYSDMEVADDAYWAACELYLSAAAANDAKAAAAYLKDLTGYKDALCVNERITGGDSLSGAGTYTLFSWGCTAAAGTLSLALHRDLLTDAQKQTLTDSIVAAADAYIGIEEAQGYGIPYRCDPDYSLPGADYYPGVYERNSNLLAVNNLIAMAYAYDLTGSGKYLDGVAAGMDYLLGNNPLAFSYITGYGSYSVTNPVHRYWLHQLYPMLPKAPAGVLAGGPNGGWLDAYMQLLGFKSYSEDTPSQRVYADSVEAWSVNESSLSANASLAWAVSFLQDAVSSDVLSGDVNGDGTADKADAEMLMNYLLGAGDVTVPRAADMNHDARLNAVDLSLLKRALLS